jgi:hypothetical protein
MQSDNRQSDDPAKLLTSQDVRPARPLIANQCATAARDVPPGTSWAFTEHASQGTLIRGLAGVEPGRTPRPAARGRRR